MKNIDLILTILAAVLLALAVFINPPERYDRLRFIAAALLALTITLLTGCTYEDTAAFGRALDSTAANYYRGRQPAYVAPVQPVAAPPQYPVYPVY